MPEARAPRGFPTMAWGQSAVIDSGRPASPSQQTNSTSRQPRLRSSVSTSCQNLAPSLCWIQIPRTCVIGVDVDADHHVGGLVGDHAALSSMHNTIAFCGGFRYKPTTSTSLSSNLGSLDTLTVSTRWGLKPRPDHMRCTVAARTPTCLAIVRHHQSVAPAGVAVWSA